MTLHTRTTAGELSMSAVSLLCSAIAHPRMTVFGAAELESFIHPRLRYSHRGAQSNPVPPLQAFDELIAAAHVLGTPNRWWRP